MKKVKITSFKNKSRIEGIGMAGSVTNMVGAAIMMAFAIALMYASMVVWFWYALAFSPVFVLGWYTYKVNEKFLRGESQVQMTAGVLAIFGSVFSIVGAILVLAHINKGVNTNLPTTLMNPIQKNTVTESVRKEIEHSKYETKVVNSKQATIVEKNKTLTVPLDQPIARQISERVEAKKKAAIQKEKERKASLKK